MAKYLKDFIGMTSDGKLTARVASIGPVDTNKNGKQFRKVTFVFPATGQTIEEGIFEFNFSRGLTGLKSGDDVEMKLENGWPVFKILERDGSSQTQSNQQMVKNERTVAPMIQQNDSAKELKDIQICLQGFMQAYISGQAKEFTFQGQDMLIADALSFAEKARAALIKRSNEIRIGVGPMAHSPAQVAVVDSAFGTDQSAPLPQSNFEDTYHPDQDLNQ